jgi:hypothetical protein
VVITRNKIYMRYHTACLRLHDSANCMLQLAIAEAGEMVSTARRAMGADTVLCMETVKIIYEEKDLPDDSEKVTGKVL